MIPHIPPTRRPLRPFGSALAHGKIISPALITERTRRLQPCEQCGEQFYQCECKESERDQ